MDDRRRDGSVRVSVAATSANLGPGYDALGLALALRDEVEIGYAPGGLTVRVSGEGAGSVARDETNLVVRAARAAFDQLGTTPPGLRVDSCNAIPHGRGLGSSAAAIVAGVAAAYALSQPERELDPAWVLRLAAGLEGHADNVAACVYGGLTVAWSGSDGAAAVRTEPAVDLRPVVLLPAQQQSTELARAALPPTVPHADAAFAAGRAALLVTALTGRLDLLYAATEDRLHQPYRAPGMPETAQLLGDLRAAGLPAVVSGAGPAILVLTRAAGEVVDAWSDRLPAGWTIWPLEIDRRGVEVRR